MENAQIKVEVKHHHTWNFVATFEEFNLYKKLNNIFSLFAEVQRLADADLYGGKLCAALDRQHPRDLYDVMLLQAEGAIPDEIRHAFVIYLASHNRPIAEILAPRIKPLEGTFFSKLQWYGRINRLNLVPLNQPEIQLFRVGSKCTY